MSEAEDDGKGLKYDAPEWLTKRGRKVFRELMRRMGSEAKESDLSLYADYAQTSADIERLTGEVDKEGFTVECMAGVKANPKAQLLSAARSQLAALRRDLNLTPKARSEKVAAKKAKPFAGL